jgi:hypothetical protein
MLLKTSNVWAVQMTLPPIPNTADRFRRYVTNKRVVVFAETLERALGMVREAFPDATFYAANHRGKDEMYFDGDSVVPAPALVGSPSERPDGEKL